ncbi:MAG: D-alanyl-D-alanine carboxypeptidase family protein, partial [Xanthomonadales bacterium]|nr:D-alanyl-D-alanine carboxypeptidase family protein [Xanthomonadales bacterium]
MPRTALSHRQLSLRNTDAIELWPASLLRPRGSADARVLAR